MGKMLILRESVRPIWELDPLICPIIGTCLTLKELSKIGRRFGYGLNGITPFELHNSMVGACQKSGPVARAVQKYLNEKYWLTVQRIDDLEADDLTQAWEDAVCEGKVAEAFWAIITREDTPSSLIRDIFGEVHMMSHLQAAQSRLDLKEMAQLRDDYRRLKERLSKREGHVIRARGERDEARRNIAEKEGAVEHLKRELSLARKRLKRLEEGEELQRLKEENADLRARLARGQDLRERIELRLKAVEDETRQKAEFPGAQDKDFDSLEVTQTDHPVQPEGEEYPGLCARRILFVGGLERLEPHYRRLVEDRGGVFERHDGDCRRGQNCLEGMISRADFVACPVNCNSHQACLCVKRLCKELRKLYVMLPNSGVATFQKALARVAYEKPVSNPWIKKCSQNRETQKIQ